jgi:HAD superfamily hydrolase (TIGR01549 family)
LKAALRAHGLPYGPAVLTSYRRINEELWAAYRRGELSQPRLARERFRRLLREVGGTPRLARDLGETYLDHLSQRGERLPGCRPALQTLRKRFRLGVVTNGIDRVQRSRLAIARLDPFFEVVVTSQGCGYAKPDPRILHVALEALEVSPKHTLYVGDDPATDGGAARAAGVRFCWVDDGRPVRGRRPALRVESLRELAVRLPPSLRGGL